MIVRYNLVSYTQKEKILSLHTGFESAGVLEHFLVYVEYVQEKFMDPKVLLLGGRE